MNSKIKKNIELFLSGFESKYNDNKNYFIKINWETVSGRKVYNGNARLDDNDKFIYSFAGVKVFDNISDVLSEILNTVVSYDSAKIEYEERGQITSLIISDRGVKLEKKDIKNDMPSLNGLKDKDYNIDLNKASLLLKTLGFMTEEGKIRNDMIRKYNQTDRFLDLIGDMFDNSNNTTIVDCACGKSYLSFILNYYLWEQKHVRANFIGIDIKQHVIDESNAIADKLSFRNMEFICQDLRNFDDVKPDTVISLHACDVATDMALGYAIRNGAKNIICIPCCHKELIDKYNTKEFEGILKHGIFKTRFNDLLTDGIRCLKLESCGYKVSCVEYCSPLDTPKNLLIKAEKVNSHNSKAEKQYYDLLKNIDIIPSIEIYSSNYESK